MGHPTVGWIGTGAMGSPMSHNLLAAGFRVFVFDVCVDKTLALQEAGAMLAPTVADLAHDVDVVFSTIYDDAGLRDVALGSKGLVANSHPGLIHVDMSTVSPAASAEVSLALAQAGIRHLCAPVSGTVELARSARLSTFVSGDREAYDQVLPLLKQLTARQRYLGAGSEARVVKLMVNLMVFMSTSVLGEALRFGSALGLDRDTLVDAINDSIVGSSHYAVKADRFKRRDYAPAGSIDLVIKDTELALSAVSELDCPLPMASMVRQQLAELQRLGLNPLDVAVLAEVPELLQGRVDGAALLCSSHWPTPQS